MDRYTITTNFDARQLGKEFTRGALNEIGLTGIAALILILLITVMLAALGWLPTDDTDGRWHRSNMRLRTDYGTGCQYVESGSGTLFPRMNASGRQVCIAVEGRARTM